MVWLRGMVNGLTMQGYKCSWACHGKKLYYDLEKANDSWKGKHTHFIAHDFSSKAQHHGKKPISLFKKITK